MARHPVKIAFARFWSDDVTAAAVFGGLPFLFDHFEFVPSPDPDVVVYSVFPGALPERKAVRVFYTGENVRPDMSSCDWAFSFDYDEELQHPRHLRLPNYVRLGAGTNLLKDPADADAVLQAKTRFCNFVYHQDADLRNRFFDLLSKYKRVDAPGRSRTNMAPIGGHADATASRYAPGYQHQKVGFQRAYKFTVAFENASYPGYTTEKIYHPMLAGSLPIYWGNPLVHRDFNPASFLTAGDVRTLADLVDAVVALDRDDALYLRYAREPWYPDNRLTPYVDEQRILARFRDIFLGARR